MFSIADVKKWMKESQIPIIYDRNRQRRGERGPEFLLSFTMSVVEGQRAEG